MTDLVTDEDLTVALAGYGGGTNTQPDPQRLRAALEAFAPRLREREIERLAKEAEPDGLRIVEYCDGYDEAVFVSLADWLRSQGGK